ncbi:hypothetical protein ColTof3_02167 [Colletotrichum tofieldiae]|nr:hypothetical protein ColTof3_02167 [Colletotrichum tofieldiae]
MAVDTAYTARGESLRIGQFFNGLPGTHSVSVNPHKPSLATTNQQAKLIGAFVNSDHRRSAPPRISQC